MKKIILLFIVTGILVGMVTACGSAADGTQKTHDTEISQQLTFDHSETLDYAQKFSIDRYQDDYALVTITDDSRYLVVPEGKVAPDDLDPDIVVIQQPVFIWRLRRLWICLCLWMHWIVSDSAV